MGHHAVEELLAHQRIRAQFRVDFINAFNQHQWAGGSDGRRPGQHLHGQRDQLHRWPTTLRAAARHPRRERDPARTEALLVVRQRLLGRDLSGRRRSIYSLRRQSTGSMRDALSCRKVTGEERNQHEQAGNHHEGQRIDGGDAEQQALHESQTAPVRRRLPVPLRRRPPSCRPDDQREHAARGGAQREPDPSCRYPDSPGSSSRRKSRSPRA